jgi:5-methylcytosine-specific restriction protein A
LAAIGTLFYTGEGQIGNMKLRAGNKVIQVHIRDGKDLHLFEQAQRAHVRNLGQFVCTGYHEERSPDVKGNDQLRAQATAAANDGAEPEQRLVNWRKRSELIRRYVLLRANGVCEGCAAQAPFLTMRGEPYLEPHHIRRLSDGGPDDPRSIAGVCANRHRRALFH